ncbi:hypothetical protein LJC42_05000 [Eubacteriales bacterium OttesenSCG-928-K08]|nr:hypothetical protein [Eubacteriales bacterium OttesenSCG-928-K08]
MPFCKSCGTLYTKSLGVCPKCNAEQKMEEQNLEATPADESPAEAKRHTRRRWLAILLGIPALIVFIYLMGLFMKVFQA